MTTKEMLDSIEKDGKAWLAGEDIVVQWDGSKWSIYYGWTLKNPGILIDTFGKNRRNDEGTHITNALINLLNELGVA